MKCPVCNKPVCRFYEEKWAERFPVMSDDFFGVIARITTSGPWHVFCECKGKVGEGRFYFTAWLRWYFLIKDKEGK